MQFLSFFAALFLLCRCSFAASPFIQVDPTTQFFVDPQGRYRIFHGVNAVYKVPPWVPGTGAWDTNSSLTVEDWDNLRNWGFTAVRLGCMWPGVEPAVGQVNQTYLGLIEEIVNGLYSRGIYTVLDAHQDIFSRETCGEGAPDWAYVTDPGTKPFPEPVAPPYPVDPTNNYPNISQCLNMSFASYYLSDAVSNAFQVFYNASSQSQTEFANTFWPSVASYFAQNQGVLGYELINEPWCGDIYAQPDLLLVDGLADRQNLAPLYQRLNATIRAVDDQHIIFYESMVSNYYHTGLTQGPGGPSYNNRQAYSYHIYCGPTNGSGDPINVPECEAVDQYFFDDKMSDVKKLGNGGFMTEFGAMLESTAADTVLAYMTSQCDRLLQSWSYWQYKYYDDLTTTSNYDESFYFEDGTLQQSKVQTLSRTYAYAIAGKPLSMLFNNANAMFTLSYVGTPSITAHTEIYLNQAWWYPKGFTVTLSPAGTTWNQLDTNFIEIIPPANLQQGQTISVTITANQ